MPPKVVLESGQTAFAGNDYLGLSSDPRLTQALYEAAKRFGISSTSSRWALGWTEVHAQLERDLAHFFGVEDACILGATYMGGAVYYEVMRAKHDTVYSDEQVHSNQFMGMKAAGFEVVKFKHLDPASLRQKLSSHTGRPPLVATDGVYGISGELAPLAELHAVAKSFGAELFVDDAHGVFALGASGRGSLEACGVKFGDAAVLGSMSKALGCNGGFLLGGAQRVEAYRRSTHVSGASQPTAPIAAACVRALEIVRNEPTLRERMWTHAAQMRAAAAESGIDVVSTQSPIVALMLKDEHEAAMLADHFRNFRLVAPYFKYPSEPRQNLLRCAGRACYSKDELERFAQALRSRPRAS
jgi:7-keto-8-aminopelargonate synthetase-like enzyme